MKELKALGLNYIAALRLCCRITSFDPAESRRGLPNFLRKF